MKKQILIPIFLTFAATSVFARTFFSGDVVQKGHQIFIGGEVVCSVLVADETDSENSVLKTNVDYKMAAQKEDGFLITGSVEGKQFTIHADLGRGAVMIMLSDAANPKNSTRTSGDFMKSHQLVTLEDARDGRVTTITCIKNK